MEQDPDSLANGSNLYVVDCGSPVGFADPLGNAPGPTTRPASGPTTGPSVSCEPVSSEVYLPDNADAPKDQLLYQIQVKWNFSGKQQGAVLQHVDIRSRIFTCPQPPQPPQEDKEAEAVFKANYFESFPIKNGVISLDRFNKNFTQISQKPVPYDYWWAKYDLKCRSGYIWFRSEYELVNDPAVIDEHGSVLEEAQQSIWTGGLPEVDGAHPPKSWNGSQATKRSAAYFFKSDGGTTDWAVLQATNPTVNKTAGRGLPTTLPSAPLTDVGRRTTGDRRRRVPA